MTALLRMRGKLSVLSVTSIVVLLAAQPARAQQPRPLRLRGDALVQTRAPVGLLVLRGEHAASPNVDAETVTWLGSTTTPSATGDVLTMSVRAREDRKSVV